MALCPGQPGWASTRKVKPIWILLKQETMSGHGISWATCKSASCSRQISTPPLVFFQTRCPSYRPTNSVNALKVFTYYIMQKSFLHCWIVSALLTDLVKDLTQNSITVVVHKLTFRQWFRKQQVSSISVDVEFHFLLCFGMLFRKLLKNDAASQATYHMDSNIYSPIIARFNKIVHHPSHELWRAWCQTDRRRHVAVNYIHLQED